MVTVRLVDASSSVPDFCALRQRAAILTSVSSSEISKLHSSCWTVRSFSRSPSLAFSCLLGFDVGALCMLFPVLTGASRLTSFSLVFGFGLFSTAIWNALVRFWAEMCLGDKSCPFIWRATHTAPWGPLTSPCWRYRSAFVSSP